MSNTILILGGAALIGLAYYCYRRKKGQDPILYAISKYLRKDRVFETVDSFSLDDLTSYFKCLKLRKGHDVPFIANALSISDILKSYSFKSSKKYAYFFATFNEDTNEVENYKAIETDNVDSKVLELMGNEKLVVLS